MKKKLLISLMLAMTLAWGGNVWGQILTFEFSSLAGNEASAPSNSNDANLTASTITRGAGLTASANGGRFNATSWALTSIDNAVSGDDYMEFTITPQSGFQFSVSSIYIQMQRSSTGPSGIALRSSSDGYASNLDQEYSVTDNTSTQSFTFTFSQANSSTAITYRVYMWAESTTGSGGIGDGSGNDIIVYGITSSAGGNISPSITNITQTPTEPTSSQIVSVSADVTDSDGTISSVELHWGSSSGSLGTTITMSNGGSGDTYTTSTDIPAQADGATIYYEIYAVDNAAGETTSAEQSYTVNDPNTTTLPYTQDFASSLGDCYTYSVSGDTKAWEWNASGYAAMNGYNSGVTEEDWLILPGINLDNYTDEILTFESWYQYGTDDANNYLKLMYSTDYSGTTDPGSSTWSELAFTAPSSESTWTSSGNVDISSITGTSVWFAFKYHYEVGNYRSWGIDNISITETLYPVTFYVDMTNAGSFTNVDIAGDFNSWGTPVQNLTLEGNNIYSITTSDIFSIGDEISFKFRKDASTWESDPNRSYTIVSGTNTYHAVWDVMVPAAISWANLQWPASSTINLGDAYNVYGQAYANGLTGSTGAPNLSMWIGYNDADTDPSTWSNWVSASFNSASGSNDEYVGDLGAAISTAGVYYYATRFKLGMADYVYGGYSSGGGGFWDGSTYVSQVLTVMGTEPSTHVTDFTASANSSSTITVSWTDASAEHYLIKASTTSFAAIDDPVDGVAEADGTLVKNADSGDETMLFNSLDASTSYYFKIFPYNGTGTTANYYTGGTVPTATATTSAYEPPILIISEVADPKDEYNGRFVELYNAGGSELDFSTETYYLTMQTNGSTYSDVQLTGTIPAHGIITLSYSTSNFTTDYGLAPDINSGFNGSGDDGYFLYYNGDHTSGTLVDAYGVIDEDGTGKAWEYTDTKAVRLASITAPNSTWTASEWHIPSQANIADMTPSEHKTTVTWQGTTSSVWNLKGDNWSGTYGFIPDASFDVTIPSGLTNYPTIAAAAACNNITIESTASGDASLLGQSNLTVNGTITVERYTTQGVWHGIAGSLDNDDFNSLYFNGNPDVWAMSYDESANDYNYVSDLGTDLGDAQGWMVWIGGSTAQTFSFNGDFRTGAVGPVSLTNTGPDADHGYNFTGNPYPSSIDWDAASGWTKNNVDAGFWVYNPTANNFMSYVTGVGGINGGTQYIAMGQGFFVQVNAAQSSGSLSLSTDVQLHNSVAFKSSKNSTPHFIKLMVSDGDRSDESIIHLNELATSGYDGQLDLHKMFSWDDTYPQLYSTDNNNMAINCLPFSTNAVNMNVRGEDGQKLTLSLSEVSDFEGVYVQDNKTDHIINLLRDNYDFIHDASMENRFTLLFTMVGHQESIIEDIIAYGYDRTIRVVNPASESLNIEVINMLGQTIKAKKLTTGTNDLLMNQRGTYLLRITDSQGHQLIRKVILR